MHYGRRCRCGRMTGFRSADERDRGMSALLERAAAPRDAAPRVGRASGARTHRGRLSTQPAPSTRALVRAARRSRHLPGRCLQAVDRQVARGLVRMCAPGHPEHGLSRRSSAPHAARDRNREEPRGRSASGTGRPATPAMRGRAPAPCSTRPRPCAPSAAAKASRPSLGARMTIRLVGAATSATWTSRCGGTSRGPPRAPRA